MAYKMTLKEIVAETAKDEVLLELWKRVGKVESISKFKKLKEFNNIFKELIRHKSGVLLRNDLIVMPTSLRVRAIKYAHEGHLGIVLCKRLLLVARSR